jgi:hypothetical protein
MLTSANLGKALLFRIALLVTELSIVETAKAEASATAIRII